MDKIGKYEIIRELGRGATATVFLATDRFSQREVAIKVAFPEILKDEERGKLYTHLFLNEASLVGKLLHPHIVQIFDAVVAEDLCYIVMEYVAGSTLEVFTTPETLLPIERVVEIIFKCTRALDFAYRIGITHRDIKPANILLVGDNPKSADIKSSDFGAAIIDNPEHTQVSGIGSPAYMSPEQVKNYPLNQKTDLYSLGVVLFQLLTGRLPFRAPNQGALIYKIVNMDTPSVCDLNPNLPAGLGPILKKALEKDLYNRYRNGAEFAKDLSTVRYQMADESDTQQDTKHFEMLRAIEFFAEFEDIELWEVLRISVWREVSSKVALIREGDNNRLFGVVVKGFVEVSVDGRALCRLGAGEVVGEMAYLHPSDTKRSATVVTLEPTLFLEINSAALDLSSDELVERFRKTLIAKVLSRLRGANKALAKSGLPAVQGRGQACDLELAPP